MFLCLRCLSPESWWHWWVRCVTVRNQIRVIAAESSIASDSRSASFFNEELFFSKYCLHIVFFLAGPNALLPHCYCCWRFGKQVIFVCCSFSFDFIFIWLTIFTYSALIIQLWLYFTFTLVGQSEEVIYIWKGTVANIACFNSKGPYNGGKMVMYKVLNNYVLFCMFLKEDSFFETFRFDHLADAFTQRDLKWGQ